MRQMFMKPLGKDISMSEIQTLVDSGMKRKEICATLGISYPTLARYIGPAYNRTKREPEEKPQTLEERYPDLAERLQREVNEGIREAPKAIPQTPKKPRFQNRVEHHTVCIEGTYATYVIDMIEHRVAISTIFEKESLTTEELGEVIEEMRAIQQEMKDAS